MEIRFENSWVLYLGWLIVVFIAFFRFIIKKHEENLNKIIFREMQKKLLPPASKQRVSLQFYISLAGFIFALLAMARPQWGFKDEIVFTKGRNIVIALDVSKSMLANDVKPSRLIRAKADITDIIRELKGDRAALITFRGKAAVICPLTVDYSFLLQTLELASIDSAPAGSTDIADAIYKSIETLEGEMSAHNAIIIISDGEDMSGRAKEAAELAAKHNIPIFTVGIGSRSGSTIPEKDFSIPLQYKGSNVITRLNDATLHEIAKITGGAYLPIGTAGIASTTLGTLYRDHLRKIAAKELEESKRVRRVERFQWFLFPSIICFILATLLSPGRLASKQEPSFAFIKTKILAIIPFLLLFNSPVYSQSNYTSVVSSNIISSSNNPTNQNNSISVDEACRRAYSFFEKGKYKEAADFFKLAADHAVKSKVRYYLYNAAVSLYQAGEYQRAAELFGNLISTQNEYERDYLNGLAASLYKEADKNTSSNLPISKKESLLRKSAESLKEILRKEPDSQTARNNLSAITKQLSAIEQDAAIERILARYGNISGDELSDIILQNQRTIRQKITEAATNSSPDKIKIFEDAAKLQHENALLCTPLKLNLQQAILSQGAQLTNDIYKQIGQVLDISQSRMLDARETMRDINENAIFAASDAENGIYAVWKGIAPYDRLLREDILRQTNSIYLIASAVTNKPDFTKGLEEQTEALELTKLFKERFKASVPEQQMPQSTNSSGTNTVTGITPETRLRILGLADNAIQSQERAINFIKVNNIEQAGEEQAYSKDYLEQILALLPKQPPQKQEEKNQNKEEERNAQQQEQPSEEQKQLPQEQKETQQPDEKQEEKEKLPQDIQKMLEKALQREKQHEEEIKERNRSIPLAPMEKDW